MTLPRSPPHALRFESDATNETCLLEKKLAPMGNDFLVILQGNVETFPEAGIDVATVRTDVGALTFRFSANTAITVIEAAGGTAKEHGMKIDVPVTGRWFELHLEANLVKKSLRVRVDNVSEVFALEVSASSSSFSLTLGGGTTRGRSVVRYDNVTMMIPAPK